MKQLTTSLASWPERRWLVAIVLAGLLLRGAAIALYAHAPESDELAYLAMARNLLAGKGMVDIFGNFAMYNMGYPLFVLTPVFAVFGDSMLAARVANALLGALAICLCHALAREAGLGRRGRLIAAALWALYLPAALYSVYILKESLLIPLMLGLLWCALRFARRLDMGTAARCGLLFGLVALTGNAGLALGAAVGLGLLMAPAPLVRKLQAGVLMGLIAALVATPWLVRNSQVLDAAVLNTNGGFNLYLGNNPNATGMFMSIADTPRGASWEALRQQGEVHASAVLRGEALAWIKADPGAALALSFKKLVMFWTPPLHAGQDETSTVARLVRAAWALQFIVIALAAVGALALRQARSRDTAILWTALAAYSGVHMIFYVIFRYREPIMPVMCVLAAIGLARLLGPAELPDRARVLDRVAGR